MSFQNKSLGQHWLYDKSVLNEVADSADVKENRTVLEVGPGLGTLTSVLLERGATVIAVEKDANLARNLKKANQLQVIEEDILQYDLNSLPKGYKVAANIPY